MRHGEVPHEVMAVIEDDEEVFYPADMHEFLIAEREDPADGDFDPYVLEDPDDA